jgi:hypothetical protein
MFVLSAKPSKEIQMHITPASYYMETIDASAVVVRDNSTGHIITINGPRVYVWLGKKNGKQTLTVSGYDHRTGKYTQKVKRLTRASLLGFILNDGVLRQWDVVGNTIG